MRRALALLLATFALIPSAHGHRLDEYLQATLVVIEPDSIRFQINLTPGIEVAEKVLARIDQNRDGVISTNEAAAYGEQLKRDLAVRLDNHDLDLKLTASSFPELTDLRSGSGIIQFEFAATVGPPTAGAHRLTLDNQHFPDISVYLVNAAMPKSAAIRILNQKRNTNQSHGEIEFEVLAPSNPTNSIRAVVLTLVVLLALAAAVRWRSRPT